MKTGSVSGSDCIGTLLSSPPYSVYYSHYIVTRCLSLAQSARFSIAGKPKVRYCDLDVYRTGVWLVHSHE
jgi:hypothetical protein